MKIPVLDLRPEIEAQWDELNAAFQSVLRSGHFILGPQVAELEKELAAYLGVRHAIGVNSGTDALLIGLRAAGVGPGDEVITTPFTFFATGEAVTVLGATPVFVDIDPDTFNLRPDLVKKAVTGKTKAILPVHVFGNPCDMAPLLELARERGLKVVEDTAQAMGAEILGRKCGTLGDVGCYSFFPSKNLGGFGDGGLITTNDDKVAESCRMLRAHGSRKKYYNETVGYNSRLDELQAALLRVKLTRLDGNNAGRREAAARYDRLLAAVEGVRVPRVTRGATPVYHQYTIRVPAEHRDGLVEAMGREGIGTMVYYPHPLHRLPVYASDKGPRLPEAERACAEVLSLPLWPTLEEKTQKLVVDALGRLLASRRRPAAA